jgi:hypothetical protein
MARSKVAPEVLAIVRALARDVASADASAEIHDGGDTIKGKSSGGGLIQDEQSA